MRKTLLLLFLIAVGTLSLPFSSLAQAGADAVASPPPDYSLDADWVCYPGNDGVCTTGLDAKVVYHDGSTSTETFVPATDPPIDCFYVYPTVSREDRNYADLEDGAAIQKVTRSQVGRLSSRCRVFAPLYRQATLKYLAETAAEKKANAEPYPQDDIRNAWEYYLAHYNQNGRRGVVLIGHSQGTLILQNLIQTAIDGNPDIRSRVVSVFLAGDPSLAVVPGTDQGITLPHIPVCSAESQVGCVYVWGDYLGQDHPSPVFGAPPSKSAGVSACRNPSAPRDGLGILKFFYENPDTSADAPPFVEAVGQLIGACEPVSDEPGAMTFNVRVLEGPEQTSIQAMLEAEQTKLGANIGLHPLDLGLPQGNILDVLDAEIETWKETHSYH